MMIYNYNDWNIYERVYFLCSVLMEGDLLYSCFQVAYAAKDLKAEIIIDLATLTGAQGLATGEMNL